MQCDLDSSDFAQNAGSCCPCSDDAVLRQSQGLLRPRLNLSFRRHFRYSNQLYNFILLFSIFCYFTCNPVIALRRIEYDGLKEPEKYACDQDFVFYGPMWKLLSKARFEQPCKCRADWNKQFCDEAESFQKNKYSEKGLPIICVCRQLTESYPGCYQFMTRCFKKTEKECFCCFNQPGDHCNQLSCSKGRPDFSSEYNTTCVCHFPPSYPYHICPSLNVDPSIILPVNPHMSEGGRTQLATAIDEEPQEGMMISGIRITPKTALIVVFSLLGCIVLLTCLLIIVRNYRLRKEHSERSVRRRTAQAALLQRRADEDRYLP